MRAAVLSVMTSTILSDFRSEQRLPVLPLSDSRRRLSSNRTSSSFTTRIEPVLRRVSNLNLIMGQRDVDRLMRTHNSEAHNKQNVENKEQTFSKARQLQQNRIDRYIAGGT